MILIDNNQIMLASFFQHIKHSEFSEDLIRHMVLNTLRMYRTRFKDKYGELVVCHDAGNYWRKDIFPEYKANRKRLKEQTDHDWDLIFELFGQIREEIQNIFPWKHILVERAEADDIIAALCIKTKDSPEKNVIVSSDKDFQQLQCLPNVQQFCPRQKQFIVCEDPKDFLLTHIIKGDSSDGIPNILSDSDTFINPKKRQKPCGKKRLDVLKESLDSCDEDVKKRFEINKKLVDLHLVPENIINTTIDEYVSPNQKGNILNYFIEHGMKQLIEHSEEFI
jgi:5'-3' exonuclease